MGMEPFIIHYYTRIQEVSKIFLPILFQRKQYVNQSTMETKSFLKLLLVFDKASTVTLTDGTLADEFGAVECTDPLDITMNKLHY